MSVKSEVLVQKEEKTEYYRKKQTETQGSQLSVNIGDPVKCPECKTMARVIWVSQDKKTMGVQCHASHREADKPGSKFKSTVHSTKTRRNVVFLLPVA
jgi:hypothetical protein